MMSVEYISSVTASPAYMTSTSRHHSHWCRHIVRIRNFMFAAYSTWWKVATMKKHSPDITIITERKALGGIMSKDCKDTLQTLKTGTKHECDAKNRETPVTALGNKQATDWGPFCWYVRGELRERLFCNFVLKADPAASSMSQCRFTTSKEHSTWYTLGMLGRSPLTIHYLLALLD